MRVLATSYLIFASVVLGILFVMQLPGVLIVFLAITLGLGYILIYPVINLGVWIVIFAPAALGAWFNWRIGAVMAGLILTLAISFPRWVPDPSYEGVAPLEPPLPAAGPVEVRSVQFVTKGWQRGSDALIEPAIEALKRNPDLDWIRIGGAIYERKDGVLHKVHPNKERRAREADVVITIPLGKYNGFWPNASLSPWKVDDVAGYLIHDARTDEPLARNLSLTVERAVKPFVLEVTGMRMDANSDPRIEFVREPYGEVAQDPDQTLESDMRTLGLWQDKIDHGNPTNSTFPAVDAMLTAMLTDENLLPAKGLPKRGLSNYELWAIKDFNDQMAARLAISERIELIARVEQSKLKGVDRKTIIEVAAETPALMSHMVEMYYADLLADKRHYGRWQRVATKGPVPFSRATQGYEPFARAIGRDRERFLMALEAGPKGKRAFLLQNIFAYGVKDPYDILRTVFHPSPPGDPFEARMVEGYRAEWKEPWRREEILKNLRGGMEATKSAKQQEADMVIRLLLVREEVAPDVLTGFVEDWVMTRRSPILHDYKVLLEVLEGLDRIGADELRAKLLIYFAAFVEHRPHWMDAPS